MDESDLDARIESLEGERRFVIFVFLLAVIYAGVIFMVDLGPGALGKILANLGTVTAIVAIVGLMTTLAGVQLRLWELRQERKRQGR